VEWLASREAEGPPGERTEPQLVVAVRVAVTRTGQRIRKLMVANVARPALCLKSQDVALLAQTLCLKSHDVALLARAL
jgi:hypothetical protein